MICEGESDLTFQKLKINHEFKRLLITLVWCKVTKKFIYTLSICNPLHITFYKWVHVLDGSHKLQSLLEVLPTELTTTFQLYCFQQALSLEFV